MKMIERVFEEPQNSVSVYIFTCAANRSLLKKAMILNRLKNGARVWLSIHLCYLIKNF